jgi:hypothetical protein
MSSHHDRIDVLKNRALCADVRGVRFVYDHGPVLPSEPSRAEMRTYLRDYDDWLRDTGGRPCRIALNNPDAQEALRHRRYSRSATEREPVQVQPQTTGQVVIDLVSASGGGAQFGGYWLLEIPTQIRWIVFSCDKIEWLSRGRGAFVETTPVAH